MCRHSLEITHRNEQLYNILFRPKKINCLFPVTVRTKKGFEVGKKKKFALFIWSKMCVLCMFYDDWELGGPKNFRVGIFVNKNLLG